MNSPKISVIVPVYKAENYLHRCVDSILAQTFTNFEVLLIDDGSPDKSGEICDEYALKDSRVRVFHKQNGGVSSARQCGIDNARGEYTIHADPDDWVEPKMLEDLYRKAKEEDADWVICDFYENFDDEQRYHEQQPSALDHEIVLLELLSEKLHGSCWNKLVRRSCFDEYNIKFPREFSLNEDLYVNMSLMRNTLRISYLSKAYYHYQIGLNLNAITSTRHYSEQRYSEDVVKIQKFTDMMKGHKLEMMTRDMMTISLLNRIFEWGELSSYEYSKRTIKYIFSIIRYKYCPTSTKMKHLLSCVGLYKHIYRIAISKRM